MQYTGFQYFDDFHVVLQDAEQAVASLAGPRQNPETRPVAELTHAMWFDSEEETLAFLQKSSLQPEQSSTGAWQLVLHRSLRVDPQAASFRQRSARLCSLQLPCRSQNVRDQAESAAADIQVLVSGSTAMLQSRQSSLQAGSSQLPSLQQTQSQWPAVPQTPLASTSQVFSSLALGHASCSGRRHLQTTMHGLEM